MPRWTNQQEKLLRQMAADGASGPQIAEALGRLPSAIRVRASILGVHIQQRQKKNGHDGHVALGPALWLRLRIAADQHNTTAAKLARELLADLIFQKLEHERTEIIGQALAEARARTKAELPDNVVVFAPNPKPSPLAALSAPQLYGRVS